MRRSRLTAGLAVLGAVTATIVGTTVASAANSAPMEHITFLSARANGAQVVIAQGPIHARGKVVTLSNSVDSLQFPNGNLRVRHQRTGKGVNIADRTTCYLIHRESGTYQVLRGTGAYRGATGHGTYHLEIRIVGCHPKKPPLLFMFVVNASGPLHG